MHSQKAQMAELVDALVSNTNTSRCTGSSPVLGTLKDVRKASFFCFIAVLGYIIFTFFNNSV